MNNNPVIDFNKPFLTGKETQYITEAVASLKISGNGAFTRKCHDFFTRKYGFTNCLLTSSCTDALEMTALLLNIKEGDEVIVPSYTFVSSSNAFVLRGAKIIFADSEKLTPNIDPTQLESLITPRTRAIVVVHYGGIACDMDLILAIARRHDIAVIEDSAHAIDSRYKNKWLGSCGTFSTFSFHETKNVISGEGGMLVVNDASFGPRSEVIWEKGTNRSAFFRGEVDKYNWIDIGSSFLPSEIIAAFLFAQLENIEVIQEKRIAIWKQYEDELKPLEHRGIVRLPHIPPYATVNGHLFHLVCENLAQRQALIAYLRARNIFAIFHYQSLHNSPFYSSKHDGRPLPMADMYSDCLVRLPLHFALSTSEVSAVSAAVRSFFDGQ